ncbi:hypothetical protein [Heyndrickxia camelliae]|uniref:Uracil-DNA glycosylase-like domain-containing protein n=1 Tax=Heyndrickxia camelliae TaxID=1707093 RepID=A0A2N3LFR1_9BACI|nr:hypothetical protein [Heyndrickxia camelliae]PKR83439.1 hypothetical protein CWO92_18925 [Heyndrickxia camelliae]
MAIVRHSKFNRYKNLIFSLKVLNEETLKSKTFLLEKDEKKKIEVYYAPFDYINEEARIVIVGITPGWYQMKQAFSAVKSANHQWSDEEILHEVKKQASFSGPMRKNLITMLDELQLQNHLGLSSTSELFGKANHFVHTVSILSYPVFYKGKNYNGSTPNMLKSELLKKYILQQFTKELLALDNPLIIPLGVNVSKVLLYLAENGYIDHELILRGFPHPSGGNGHRHKQFAENKEGMKQQLERYFVKKMNKL